MVQPFPTLIPAHNLPEAKIAVLFAELSQEDLRAAKVLYQNELYPEAVYMLQQSVEKAVKSFGLMLRLVKPKDLRAVSHMTYRVLLSRTENFAHHLGRSINYLGSTNDKDVELIRSLGWGEVLDKASEFMPSDDRIRADRWAAKNLDDKTMWEATLNLSRDNEVVKSALDTMLNIPIEKAMADLTIYAMGQVARMVKGSKSYVDYNLGMIKSSPRAWSLSLITMWHEAPTRYPPVSRLDHWRYGEYTKDKALLKQFPMLVRQARILTNNVLLSARASVRLATMNS